MAGSLKVKQRAVLHNLQQYESVRQAFNWEKVRGNLPGCH